MKFLVLLIGLLSAAPAFAQEKAESCNYQGDVVAAVQQARLDRVRERKVPQKIKATNPSWPEKYNAVIPLVAPWVYDMKRSDLKEDLRAVWVQGCLAQP